MSYKKISIFYFLSGTALWVYCRCRSRQGKFNFKSNSEIICFHTGSMQHSLAKQFTLLPVEIYKKNFFISPLTIIAFSSTDAILIPKCLFNIVQKINIVIMTLFSFELHLLLNFIVSIGNVKMIQILLFGEVLCDFVVLVYRVL